MTLAVGAVLVLAFILSAVVTATYSQSLSARTQWLLLLLALAAGMLAALRHQGAI